LATIDGDHALSGPFAGADGWLRRLCRQSGEAYHKTVEIEANPRVELCYLDDHHDQVRLTGIAGW